MKPNYNPHLTYLNGSVNRKLIFSHHWLPHVVPNPYDFLWSIKGEFLRNILLFFSIRWLKRELELVSTKMTHTKSMIKLVQETHAIYLIKSCQAIQNIVWGTDWDLIHYLLKISDVALKSNVAPMMSKASDHMTHGSQWFLHHWYQNVCKVIIWL